MTRFLITLISIYQKTLSPDHSYWGKLRYPHGYCRFAPSCSAYAKQVLEEFGPWKGLALGLWRIFRCNPFVSGGYDPAIKKF